MTDIHHYHQQQQGMYYPLPCYLQSQQLQAPYFLQQQQPQVYPQQCMDYVFEEEQEVPSTYYDERGCLHVLTPEQVQLWKEQQLQQHQQEEEARMRQYLQQQQQFEMWQQEQERALFLLQQQQYQQQQFQEGLVPSFFVEEDASFASKPTRISKKGTRRRKKASQLKLFSEESAAASSPSAAAAPASFLQLPLSHLPLPAPVQASLDALDSHLARHQPSSAAAATASSTAATSPSFSTLSDSRSTSISPAAFEIPSAAQVSPKSGKDDSDIISKAVTPQPGRSAQSSRRVSQETSGSRRYSSAAPVAATVAGDPASPVDPTDLQKRLFVHSGGKRAEFKPREQGTRSSRREEQKKTFSLSAKDFPPLH